MNYKYFSFFGIIFLLTIILTSCATTPKTPPKTQLQIREFQTKTFEISDSLTVMKAMINVLQDEGFTVENANVELGLITASKETDIESGWDRFFAELGDALDEGGYDARWSKSMLVETSANVTGFGESTKVRANFRAKHFDNRGGILKVYQIEDEQFYRDFFAKVDKAIFLQKEKL